MPARAARASFFTLFCALIGLTNARADFRAFFAPSHCAAIALSPDGTHVAYLQLDDGPAPKLIVVSVVTWAGDDSQILTRRLPPSLPTAARGAWSRASGAAAVLLPRRDEVLSPRISWLDSDRMIVTTAADEIFLCTAAGQIRKLADPQIVAGSQTDISSSPAYTNISDAQRLAGLSAPGEAQIARWNRPCRFIASDLATADILVEAQGAMAPLRRGSLGTTLYRVSLADGHLTQVAESWVVGLFLYDRQGRARIVQEKPASLHSTYNLAAANFFGSGNSSRSAPLGDCGAVPSPDAFSVDVQNYLGHRAYPVGFGADPNVMYYASNLGRDTYGVYGFNLAPRRPTGERFEDPDFDVADPLGWSTDRLLVFDRRSRQLAGVRRWGGPSHSIWRDAEIAAVQAEIEGKFPHRRVTIEAWSDDRRCFLFHAAGESDSGRYLLYDRNTSLPLELARSLPRSAPRPAEAETFTFTAADGVRLSASLIRPPAPQLSPPPLVVICRGSPWETAGGASGRDSQALASMGFVVLTVHYRGSAGYGAASREAFRSSPVHAPLEDLRSAIAQLGAMCPFDRTRVALFGQGYGAYLATQALQLYPEEFRCAACLDAPLAMRTWIDPSQPARQAASKYFSGRLQSSHVLPFGARSNAIAAQQEKAPGDPGYVAPDPNQPTDLKAPLPVTSVAREDLLVSVRASFLQNDPLVRKPRSAADQAGAIQAPVLFIVEASALNDAAEARHLRDALAARSIPAALVVTPNNAVNRAETAMSKVREFFNLTLYSFGVKIGPIREIEGTP